MRREAAVASEGRLRRLVLTDIRHAEQGDRVCKV